MKFYIASKISNKEAVKEIHRKILSKGYEYVSNWIDTEDIKPYAKNQKQSKEVSKECVENINNCNIFVLIADEGGKGRYIELGIALQLANTKNKPKIYVIGEQNTTSIFYFHPLIKRMSDIEDVLEDIS